MSVVDYGRGNDGDNISSGLTAEEETGRKGQPGIVAATPIRFDFSGRLNFTVSIIILILLLL